MKNKSIFLLLIIMFMLLPSFFIKSPSILNAQNLNYQKKITLMGTSEISITPDLATINLGIETVSENLELAQKENKQKINNLITILLENGILKQNIKTEQFYVYQQYDYSSNRKPIGYNVTNILKIETADLENLGAIISLATKNGVNIFNNVLFSVKEPQSVYNEALKKAYENAKDKFFSLMGVDAVYNNIEIVEEPQYSYTPMYGTYLKASDYSENNFVFSGQNQVKAAVKVVISY